MSTLRTDTIQFSEKCPIAEIINRDQGSSNKQIQAAVFDSVTTVEESFNNLELDPLTIVEIIMVVNDAEPTNADELGPCNECSEPEPDCPLLNLLRASLGS